MTQYSSNPAYGLNYAGYLQLYFPFTSKKSLKAFILLILLSHSKPWLITLQ